MKEVDDALRILEAFGITPERTSRAAAYTLLALANVDSTTPWSQASNERLSARALMGRIYEIAGSSFRGSSRDYIRQAILRPFIDLGICRLNDDDPTRPKNSASNSFRLSEEARDILSLYGTELFLPAVESYVSASGDSTPKCRSQAETGALAVTLSEGVVLSVEPSPVNVLSKSIVEVFCREFIAGCRIVYFAAADGETFVDASRLSTLNIGALHYDRLPNVMAHHTESDQLFLLHVAATKHGAHDPVVAARMHELHELLKMCPSQLVHVSCVPNRVALRGMGSALAWETKIWMVDEPKHLIHLD